MKKILLAALLAIANPASAVVIVADALGNDSVSDADYWGVSFASGTGAIASVTFDLASFGGDFWDFDGGATYDNATAPVITTATGLAVGDITPVFAGTHPIALSFTFATGSFMAGDLFRFGADVDQILSGDEAAGLAFSVVMENGDTGSGTFAVTGQNSSAVTLQLADSAVPEPASALLAMLGMAGFGALRRRC